MKKKTVLMTVLIILCTGIVFAQNGVIKEVSGTVEIKRAGSAVFVSAKAGDQLAGDTVVSTGFKSTALVASGSSTITVRPLTRLTLTELTSSAGTETINVSLQTGRVRVDVNPPAGTKTTMSVRAPNATASVRGTNFDFDTRNLQVNHGTVAFQGSKGGTVLVNAGSTSAIQADGKPADPIETNAAALVPPPPAGVADSGVENTGGALVSSTGDVTIELIYSEFSEK